jgi:class 3 adenylate cyclase
MASVAVVDLAMNSMYFVLAQRPKQLLMLLPENLLVLGVLNVVVALRIYAPIVQFVRDGRDRQAAQRALAYLPLRSAIWVALLSAGYCAVVFYTGSFIPEPEMLERIAGWNLGLAFVWFSLVYATYYSFYTFFLVDNVAISQRATLYRDYGLEIEPRGYRFRNKLIFALAVLALVPTSHLILDLLVFRDLRLAQGFDVTKTVLLDLFATVVVFCFALVLVARGILRPVRALTATVEDIEKGILDRRAAVVADDELGVLMQAVNRMVDGLSERAFIRETFGKYVPDSVAASIIEGRAPIEPKLATATILYTDIEDFTSLAEKTDPTELVAVLNAYFSSVIEVIQRFNGVVNQFQGDAMLVTFNVPAPDSRHADNAVAAALAILDVVECRKFGGHQVRTRIGVNTGLVFAGNVGSGDRYNYTVHGDAVNLAARLEALNKELGTSVLMSSNTVAVLTEEFPLRALERVAVRGRDQEVTVYTVARTHKLKVANDEAV